MKKISVIVPVYNTEKYLKRCINSIVNQTYTNLEIILVNDGSTDNSWDICKEYVKKDKRVKIFNKKNGGQSSARNLALKEATGDFLGFVDSDDWISLDMYEYLIKIMQHEEADIAFIERIKTDGKAFNNKHKHRNINEKLYKNEKIIEEYLDYGMRTGNYGLPNYLYKKELFEDIYFPEGRICEDIVTNYKLMKKAKRLIKSNKICYYYFQDNMSTTRNKFSKKDFDLLLACDELIQISREENKKIKKMIKEKRDRSDFSLLAKIAYYGIGEEENYDKQINEMIKSIKTNYFELLCTNMNFKRKIQLTAFVLNYNFILKIMNNVRRRNDRIYINKNKK